MYACRVLRSSLRRKPVQQQLQFTGPQASTTRFLSGITAPATRKKASSIPVPSENLEASLDEIEYDFGQEVSLVIQQINTAIQPLEQLNDNFKCYFEDEATNHLIVKTIRGDFDIRPDPKNSLLVVKSYISGYQNYRFDPYDRLWLSIKDGHDMRGLVTRDLLRHCVGCPHFD